MSESDYHHGTAERKLSEFMAKLDESSHLKHIRLAYFKRDEEISSYMSTFLLHAEVVPVQSVEIIESR